MFFFQLPWLPEYALGRNHAEALGRILYSTAVQKSAFPPEVIERYREAMSKPGALTAGINYYRTLFNRVRSLRSSSGGIINTPTLLIWGEQDFALGVELTRGLEQWVPNIHIKRLPDSGHWVQQEQPDAVNALILESLK